MGRVTLEDADAFAELLLREVRHDGIDAPRPGAVARAWGVGVFAAPRAVGWGELAQRVRVHGEDRIYLRTGAEGPFRALVIAHELGHVAIERWGLVLDEATDVERWCWRFGAALLCPAPLVRRAWHAVDGDLGAVLARFPQAPPTAVALRLTEAAEVPTWIIERGTARFSYSGEPSHAVLDVAREATRAGAATGPGLSAVRLPERPRRAAVAATST